VLAGTISVLMAAWSKALLVWLPYFGVTSWFWMFWTTWLLATFACPMETVVLAARGLRYSSSARISRTKVERALSIDALIAVIALVFVCSVNLDVGHDGAILSMVDTGDGVDDIDYAPATHMLYVGAAKAAKLTIARADQSGHLTSVAQVPTPAGARNAVVTKDGTVYLAHAGVKLSALVVVSPSGK